MVGLLQGLVLMHRIKATVIEIKLQIGLGILGLVGGVFWARLTQQPVSLATLGFVPGIIAIVVVGAIITCRCQMSGLAHSLGTACVIGDFKRRHPEVHTVAE